MTLGIKEYRQTAFKPYRVIYRVTGSQVIIYLMARHLAKPRAGSRRRFIAPALYGAICPTSCWGRWR
jgi:hypothetical protein